MARYEKGKCLFELMRKDPKIQLDQEDRAEYGVLTAYYQSTGYIFIEFKGKKELLHRVVMGCPDKAVDHRDGNKLDCRKANLRLCSKSQNQANQPKYINNTSGYKGVSFEQGKYWRAYITKDRKRIHIGYFPSAELAAKAYDRKALELFGEFANFNFPEELLA